MTQLVTLLVWVLGGILLMLAAWLFFAAGDRLARWRMTPQERAEDDEKTERRMRKERWLNGEG